MVFFYQSGSKMGVSNFSEKNLLLGWKLKWLDMRRKKVW